MKVTFLYCLKPDLLRIGNQITEKGLQLMLYISLPILPLTSSSYTRIKAIGWI